MNNPQACVIVYDTGAYSDWRREVVRVDMRPRGDVDRVVAEANRIVSEGAARIGEIDSDYFASESADHEKWQRRRARAQRPFRKQLAPLMGKFSRSVDLSDDGTFYAFVVPCEVGP